MEITGFLVKKKIEFLGLFWCYIERTKDAGYRLQNEEINGCP